MKIRTRFSCCFDKHARGLMLVAWKIRHVQEMRTDGQEKTSIKDCHKGIERFCCFNH